jgi:uroporphyrinogen III methyltransferase/synthase
VTIGGRARDPAGSAGPPPGPDAGAPARPGRPLAGLTVLVPRARDQAGGFSGLLRARGAVALEVPTIEIHPVASTAELDRAVVDLAAGRFDWVVLTSVNGVAALRGRVEALGHDPATLRLARSGPAGADRLPPRVGVAVVGPATEAALSGWGVAPDLVAEPATTEALGRAFPARSSGTAPGPGVVLLARADLANPELGRALRAKGWRTAEVVAYHTVPVRALDPAARRRLDGGGVDWVAFTAASTVEGFLRGYGGPPPPGVQVAAIGPVTAEAARSAGMRVAATAAEHTIPGLVAAIEQAVSG